MNDGSTLRDRIMEMRVKNKSYREIASVLGISKSTISYWISRDANSQKIRDLLTERNNARSKKRIRKIIKESKERWAAWRESARIEAISEFPALFYNPLFVAGIMIYWGEGDSKLENPLRMGNTDPRMVRVYVNFVRKIMRVPKEKIRIGLILYPDLKDKECIGFWSEITGLKNENFVKSQYIKGYHPTKRLLHGICMVVVNSRQQKIKMLEWIDLFAKKNIISR